MELVSFKVNDNGEFQRVVFTHDEPINNPNIQRRNLQKLGKDRDQFP